jgi:polyisoprenoid-binding protein YceI
MRATMRIALAAIVLAVSAHAATAAGWHALAAASRLTFVATWERTPVAGTFRAFDVSLRFDPAAPEDGTLDVTIDVASATMQSADIDAAIAGPDWFDSARFPRAEFHAASIRRTGLDRYVASGTRALKGVAVPLGVPFAWSRTAEGAAMDGELVVERARFRIGEGEWASSATIGPSVTVRFRVALRADR